MKKNGRPKQDYQSGFSRHHLLVSKAAHRAANKLQEPHPPVKVDGMAVPRSSDPFNYFEQTIVINLPEHSHRLQQMERRLNALGASFERMPGQVAQAHEACSANRGLGPGYLSCLRAHRAVVERALNCGWKNVLILEDDVVFRDDTAEWMRRIQPQLMSLSWDVFHLGLHLLQDGGRLTDDIRIAALAFHTHAYAVSRLGMPKVLNVMERAEREGWHFDSFSHPQFLRAYVTPILAIQEPGHSDVGNRHVDRLEQYFPPFDRHEFFSHCAEARGWNIDAARPQGGLHKQESLRRAKQAHRFGKLRESEGLYKQILAGEPDNADALHYLGLLYNQEGRAAAALDLIYRSVAMRSDSAEFYCNLGMVLGQAGRTSESLDALDQALALNPDYPEAHCNRGLSLERLGRSDEAITAWRRAVELNPDFAEPHNHLGQKLAAMGEAEEAVDHLHAAVRLNPRHADAHNNLGILLRRTDSLNAAAAAFRRATELRPTFAEAYSNLGTALNELGRNREAIDHLEKAIELKADFVDAHWNLATSLLYAGDMERGWLEYEWRRHLPVDEPLKRGFRQPEWNGSPLRGRTILVICEQGLGDTLQFVRYVPLLVRRGANVILECQPPLRSLLSSIDDVVVVSKGDSLPRFDTHARLMSLPGIFGTRLGSMPADVPYLRCDEVRIREWAEKLRGDGFKIGIAWQGNTSFPYDKTRSILLSHFEPLANTSGCRLFSLQKNAGVEQIEACRSRFAIQTFDPPLDGEGAFLDTAAVMKNLDLVVTSDTSIAHLAGALGVRVWVALSHNCDWRWLRDREDSPWYPTMRLFRQTAYGGWPSVFERISKALAQTMQEPICNPNSISVPMAPGELLDRLTILQIKVQKLRDPAKLQVVHAELDGLLKARINYLPNSDQLDELCRQLRHVNETLWGVEDDIRMLDRLGDFGPAFVELARTVYRTNDRRVEIKRRINLLLGSALRDEKQYEPYGDSKTGNCSAEAAPFIAIQKK